MADELNIVIPEGLKKRRSLFMRTLEICGMMWRFIFRKRLSNRKRQAKRVILHEANAKSDTTSP